MPRLRKRGRWQDALLLGAGLAIHILTRPYESILLGIAVASYFFPWRRPTRVAAIPAGLVLFALGITLAQNKAITQRWLTLPYQLSEYQYGVPAALTFQPPPVPHRSLTREQMLDYKMQLGFRGTRPEDLATYSARLLYRTRFIRFFFLPEFYVAIAAFLVTLRKGLGFWVLGTLGLFALGTNFFPAFQFHYVAAVSVLFLLATVRGMQLIRARSEICARIILLLAMAHFLLWYMLHVAGDPETAVRLLQYETWDSIDHASNARRSSVNAELREAPGQHLVFVRYWSNHIFQDEWVYNAAELRRSRVIWARDLGPSENQKLIQLYTGRDLWLLEPDARPLPKLTRYDSVVPAELTPSPSSGSPFESPK